MKDGKFKIMSVSLPEDLIDVLGDISLSENIPRSRIIKMAVESYLRVRYPHLVRLMEVHRNA